jgi:hypothetical protein
MNKPPVPRLLRVALCISFVLSACDSPIPPDSPRLTPDQLVGTYYLESLRGVELPLTAVGPTGVTQTVFAALLHLHSNEKYELLIDSGSCSLTGVCDEHWTAQFLPPRMWLLLYDGTLDFEGGQGTSFIRRRATTDGRTIVFDSTALYRRADPPQQPRSLDMRPDSLLLVRGEFRNVFATTIPWTRVVNIVVRDTTIATLLPSGALRANSPGVTYVVATVAALRDSSKITVR